MNKDNILLNLKTTSPPHAETASRPSPLQAVPA